MTQETRERIYPTKYIKITPDSIGSYYDFKKKLKQLLSRKDELTSDQLKKLYANLRYYLGLDNVLSLAIASGTAREMILVFVYPLKPGEPYDAGGTDETNGIPYLYAKEPEAADEETK